MFHGLIGWIKPPSFTAPGACSYAGLYSSHADLSAKYSGIVNGISTTFGALAGVCSNAYVGYALKVGFGHASGFSCVLVVCSCCWKEEFLFCFTPRDLRDRFFAAVEGEAERFWTRAARPQTAGQYRFSCRRFDSWFEVKDMEDERLNGCTMGRWGDSSFAEFVI